ncbi:hypothetical protein JCM5296_003447 [Sporobolomyces johnsonii]
MAASKRFTSLVWEAFRTNAGHDANSFGHMKVLDAKPGKVWAEMEVKRHQDRGQIADGQIAELSLHGGLIASLIDTTGSLALASRGMYMTGVSTDINATYVRGAALGEVIRVRGEVVNMGRTLAFTRIELESAKTGKLLAYGSHTKFIADALKSPKNIKLSEDGETVVEGTMPEEGELKN